MDRRDFLISGAFAASSLAAGAVSAQTLKIGVEPSAVKGLSILQGYTDQTSTQLAICIGVDEKVSYSLTDVETKQVFEPSSLKAVTFGSSDTRVDKMKFVGLQLGHKYHLKVLDKKKKLLDDRFLQTVDLTKQGARVAFMSCMNDFTGVNRGIWKSAEQADLDYIFFTGDSVYGDLWIFHGPAYLWSRYVQSREKIPFYRWKNLKPVIATWDDHDFGKNGGTGNYKHKDYAYHHFQAFFAQEPDGVSLLRGYGNSTYLQAFNQNFVLFDSRYYRDLPNPDGSVGFLGHDQIHWMSGVVKARPNPTWVLNGAPIYGRVEKSASYQFNAPEELNYFLKEIGNWSVPILFGAGDLHYSEISKVPKEALGFETFELISSCMHSTKKKAFYDNPNPHLNGYLHENFLMLEQVGLPSDPVWMVTCVGDEQKPIFQESLKIA